ncbi:unnamed protein product [Caenorhabditis brenneri]
MKSNSSILVKSETPISSSDNNNTSSFPRSFIKYTFFILVVLVVCGLLAFALSTVVWHFLDIEEETAPESNILNSTGLICILILCGLLSVGLPVAVWKYYTSSDHEPEGVPVHPPMPTVSAEKQKLIKPPPPIPKKRIVGYYLGTEEKGIQKFQLGKLSHAVFAFVSMDSDGLLCFKNEKTEMKFLNLKSKSKNISTDLNTMISIGGQNNSEYFSQVVADPRKQTTFIDSILNFLKTHQIDGVDIFWTWPKDSDKFKYSAFLKKLRETLKQSYIISIAAPPTGIENWEGGFDLDEILECVDFINVICMDYYGPWDNQWGNPAGPISPLYSGVGARENFNVDFTMQYYTSETKNSNKFNIVIPFYVRLWNNVKNAVQPENIEAFRNVELVKFGDGVRADGCPFIPRCSLEKERWKLSPASWDDKSKSSYIYDVDKETYLTFETDMSVHAKRNYVNQKGLGGYCIWSVDMDDSKNSLLNLLSSK